MRHNDVIFLITKTNSYDELGNIVVVDDERMVFANQMSVSMNEYYEASNSGLKPEKQFEVHSFEYDGESSLLYENEKYKIIRAPSKGEKTQIICERVIGHD